MKRFRSNFDVHPGVLFRPCSAKHPVTRLTDRATATVHAAKYSSYENFSDLHYEIVIHLANKR
jgi:hypothetical protein